MRKHFPLDWSNHGVKGQGMTYMWRCADGEQDAVVATHEWTFRSCSESHVTVTEIISISWWRSFQFVSTAVDCILLYYCVKVLRPLKVQCAESTGVEMNPISLWQTFCSNRKEIMKQASNRWSLTHRDLAVSIVLLMHSIYNPIWQPPLWDMCSHVTDLALAQRQCLCLWCIETLVRIQVWQIDT